MDNARAISGNNNPPNPIDEALAPFDATREEAESWLDGKPVETEGQMKAVDALIKEMKAARKAVEAAEESTAKPMYDAWKAKKAEFAPTLNDLDRIVKGLVACVDGFKRKLAAEKEAARKEAERKAWEATRAAQEAARLADASNIDATRAAAKAMEDAEAAQKAAMDAKKDVVKGLRTVTRYEVTDHRALLNYIAKNVRDDMTAFIDAWAAKHHKEFPNADGLRVWIEKESF
jgi:hypothetical protein